MKKQILFSLFIICTALSLMSNRGGRASRSGQGATTSPGESGQFCGSFGCHAGTTFGTNVMLTLIGENGDTTQQYVPGEEYTVNINIAHTGTPAGYGFQIVSLRDSDNTGINNFSELPNQTQELSLMDRQYIEHSDRLGTNQIDIKWTAPEEGTGDITFYAAGNAVNGNNSSSGDTGDTTRLTITESIMSSVFDNEDDNNSVTVFPNPTSDYITIEKYSSYKSLQLIDTRGKLIQQVNDSNVSLRALTNGLYYLRAVSKNNQVHISKVLKM